MLSMLYLRLVTGDLFIINRDKNTTFVKEYQLKLPASHGVSLDVLLLDGYAPNIFYEKIQITAAYIYSIFTQRRPRKSRRS